MKGQVWSVGTHLGLLSIFAGSACSVSVYAGSIEILTFGKGCCNEWYTFYIFSEANSVILASFKI